jgi:hypothetical protein
MNKKYIAVYKDQFTERDFVFLNSKQEALDWLNDDPIDRDIIDIYEVVIDENEILNLKRY